MRWLSNDENVINRAWIGAKPRDILSTNHKRENERRKRHNEKDVFVS